MQIKTAKKRQTKKEKHLPKVGWRTLLWGAVKKYFPGFRVLRKVGLFLKSRCRRQDFARFYMQQVPQTCRYVNKFDPVPRLLHNSARPRDDADLFHWMLGCGGKPNLFPTHWWIFWENWEMMFLGHTHWETYSDFRWLDVVPKSANPRMLSKLIKSPQAQLAGGEYAPWWKSLPFVNQPQWQMHCHCLDPLIHCLDHMFLFHWKMLKFRSPEWIGWGMSAGNGNGNVIQGAKYLLKVSGNHV